MLKHCPVPQGFCTSSRKSVRNPNALTSQSPAQAERQRAEADRAAQQAAAKSEVVALKVGISDTQALRTLCPVDHFRIVLRPCGHVGRTCFVSRLQTECAHPAGCHGSAGPNIRRRFATRSFLTHRLLLQAALEEACQAAAAAPQSSPPSPVSQTPSKESQAAAAASGGAGSGKHSGASHKTGSQQTLPGGAARQLDMSMGTPPQQNAKAAAGAAAGGATPETPPPAEAVLERLKSSPGADRARIIHHYCSSGHEAASLFQIRCCPRKWDQAASRMHSLMVRLRLRFSAQTAVFHYGKDFFTMTLAYD